MAASISWISVAPVKGMRVLSVEAVELTPEGLPGDREFIVVDEKNHMVNGKRFGSLMEIVPSFDPDGDRLKLEVPANGRWVEGTVTAGEPVNITFHGRPAQARPVEGDFSAMISEQAGAPLRLMRRLDGSPAVDRGKRAGVTLLGESSLESLRSAGRDFNRLKDQTTADPDPGPIDQRRFRMNFGLEGTRPFEEDEWVGREIAVGEARIRVGAQVGRCVVTTRDPHSGETDLKTLHFLRHSRESVDPDESLPFGVYGEVLTPGLAKIGDPVRPVD